ncbi:hypothetical protein SESBI_07051 [Sesbania bispinosa]|nr:hypothetical protein SESBI_07051 [Sesbania bispinosa]
MPSKSSRGTCQGSGAVNNAFSNTYNPGQAQSSNQGGKISALESALEKLTMHTSTFVERTNTFMTETQNFMSESRTNFKNLEASIRNLENQIGQMSRQLSERPSGTLPSDTIPNPREQCKAIQLRSGKALEAPSRNDSCKGKEVDVEVEKEESQGEKQVEKEVPTQEKMKLNHPKG